MGWSPVILVLVFMFIILTAVGFGVVRGGGFSPAMALAGVSMSVAVMAWTGDVPQFGYIVAIMIIVVAYFVGVSD